jgi:DNA-binding MarR family transcriptional regulator
MSASDRTRTPEPCYELGEDGLASWPDQHAGAWIGLLETHKRLTRELDGELDAEHRLTLSALEVLGRLAAAERHRMRLSALASACGLSLSRISRIVDALEARGLVERCSVDTDARAVEGCLSEAGMALVRRAQATHFASVQRLFFERLSEEEISLLAEIFSRFAPRTCDECSSPTAVTPGPERGYQ